VFCYQCEQTLRTESGAGCTVKGVCGKDEATADLQDVLVYQLKGIGQYRTRLAELGIADDEADSFVLNSLFSTLTNVNFNRVRFIRLIAEADQMRDRYTEVCRSARPPTRLAARRASNPPGT
jgi:hydroxylamine reductase